MISLHIVVDNCPEERLDRALLYLKRTNQPYVQIAAGAQIDRAMQFAQRCAIEVPGIKIFWRILEDTGNIIAMTTDDWWAQRVAPRLAWMRAYGVIMVVDNETSGGDEIIRLYTKRSIERMDKLHGEKLWGAYCRFATGNIRESQYALLKPLLDNLGDGDWVSPNEYSNLPNKSSGGHLERWKLIQQQTKRPLNIAIGEAGILNDYNPEDGYLEHMSGEAMAQKLLDEEIWYDRNRIPRFVFVIGGYGRWYKMQVNDAALETWERHYAANPIQLPMTPPPSPPPPPVPPPPSNSVIVNRAVLEGLRDTLQSQINVLNAIIGSK